MILTARNLNIGSKYKGSKYKALFAINKKINFHRRNRLKSHSHGGET